MAIPEYLVCLNCESPVYVFEWDDDAMKVTEIICTTCGHDDESEFLTQSEYDEQ